MTNITTLQLRLCRVVDTFGADRVENVWEPSDVSVDNRFALVEKNLDGSLWVTVHDSLTAVEQYCDPDDTWSAVYLVDLATGQEYDVEVKVHVEASSRVRPFYKDEWAPNG